MEKKIGLLVIGLGGAIGSTLSFGLMSAKEQGFKKLLELGMITSLSPFNNLDLIELSEITISGWDIIPPSFDIINRYRTLHNYALLKKAEKTTFPKVYSPIITKSDYLADTSEEITVSQDYQKAILKIRNDIQDFRKKNNLENVIVVNIACPHKNIEIKEWHNDENEFEEKLKSNDISITSGMLYCIAAIKENCGFIDFTPSATLIPQAIISMSNKFKVPLAGRDGSTGQTMMKSILLQMFMQRNFTLNGWYSTNILGNQDGLVLSKEEYRKEKIEDKTNVINDLLDYDVTHLVDIKYYPPRGDSKEAWDVIDFKGWLGENMSMKINWIGMDSILASPLILDLTILLEYSLRNKEQGLQSHLGVFFKNPLGNSEKRFFILYDKLLNHYKN